ncbi:PDGLE domain-containing protein [Halarchaeum sp. P4]|uniref:PDGLE domain-containing protein n=1 Tax=Halarchaeum sp. P4 TaxID=3421639 RepID=UPI003EB8A2AC
MSALSRPWVRTALAVVLLLAVLAPAFAWASSAVGYAEPLENAAEQTGAHDEAVSHHDALFPDYSVPGLGSTLGTLVSALVGAGLTLAVALGVGRFLERDGEP